VYNINKQVFENVLFSCVTPTDLNGVPLILLNVTNAACHGAQHKIMLSGLACYSNNHLQNKNEVIYPQRCYACIYERELFTS